MASSRLASRSPRRSGAAARQRQSARCSRASCARAAPVRRPRVGQPTHGNEVEEGCPSVRILPGANEPGSGGVVERASFSPVQPGARKVSMSMARVSAAVSATDLHSPGHRRHVTRSRAWGTAAGSPSPVPWPWSWGGPASRRDAACSLVMVEHRGRGACGRGLDGGPVWANPRLGVAAGCRPLQLPPSPGTSTTVTGDAGDAGDGGGRWWTGAAGQRRRPC